MKVSIFYSRDIWTRPLNEFGVQQHVFALYQEVFRGHDTRIYPQGLSGHILTEGLRHVPAVLAADLAVLCPDYPVVAGALASWLKRDRSFIVHTWKVPGFSDDRTSARVHDMLLRRVMRRAHAIVVASMMQKAQLESQGLGCPVLFAPVSVNGEFWRPDPGNIDEVLSAYGLRRNEFVLTVGGSDRDEVYGAKVASLLKLPCVRVTYSQYWADIARERLLASGLDRHASIFVNPTDVDSRALYAGSALLCLPTVTRTNPAGLTSLVEGMACGAAVAIPETIAENYIEDRVTGFLLCSSAEDFAAKLMSNTLDISELRLNARAFAQRHLNASHIASTLKQQLEATKALGA